MTKLLKYFLDENALVYIISMIYDFTTKICSSENIIVLTDYFFLNWHEATRGGGGGWRWGWRWHGCLGKYPSTHLTIYLFKIYLRVDEPTPYHTHSHELGILYLSKSVYWLYQQHRKLYFCFSNFCRSVISLHNFEKQVRFLKKEEN